MHCPVSPTRPQVLNKEQQELAAHNEYNFDHPDAFDFDLLISVLRKLKKGKSVKVPAYDFTTHSRRKEWVCGGRAGSPARCTASHGQGRAGGSGYVGGRVGSPSRCMASQGEGWGQCTVCVERMGCVGTGFGVRQGYGVQWGSGQGQGYQSLKHGVALLSLQKTIYGANVVVFEGILSFANKELLKVWLACWRWALPGAGRAVLGACWRWALPGNRCGGQVCPQSTPGRVGETGLGCTWGLGEQPADHSREPPRCALCGQSWVCGGRALP